MVATKLVNFLNAVDKYNVAVGSWAQETGRDGVARCKYCQSNVKFASGKNELFKHSERQKHRDATPKEEGSVKQISISQAMQKITESEKEELEIKERTREFEISIARALSYHNISGDFIDCLQRQLKTHCGDSIVVQRMRMGRSKCQVMQRMGISPTYRAETVEMMKTCDSFSIGFDESEVNKISELEIMVRVSSERGICLRHYRTLDLESGTAQGITDELFSQMDEDGVDYKKKLLSAMTDGCNVMQGQHGGVKRLLSEKIPQFFDPGSCNDHHLSNAMKHAVNKFDPDIEKALVNLYVDIGGQKGRGLKRKKAFEKVCKVMALSPLPIKRFCATRFRAVRTCIKPVLYNWNALIRYYSGLKKPTPRQKLLQGYFVEREMMSYLNLNFIFSATREIDEAIDHFERRNTMIYGASDKMEQILRNCLMKFHDETSCKKLVDDCDDDERVQKKSGAELLHFDVDNEETLLKKKQVFIGEAATTFIKELSLNPLSSQLSKFYENVMTFHRTVALKYQQYFRTGILSTELNYISAFDPKKHNYISTPAYIKYLAKNFSKIVENIECIEGQDKLFQEIENYSTDEEVKEFVDLEFEDYWLSVLNLKDGEWKRYYILPRFALAFGTLFNSNSESERAFSVQTDIHRNPKRNLMDQDTFDGHLQIHYGVECKEVKALCTTCVDYTNASSQDKKVIPPHHCHCSVAPISEQMKETCKKMWNSNQARINEKNKEIQVDQVKVKANEEEFNKRKLQFATSLKTRATFYAPVLMGKVFEEQENDHKKNKKAKESPSLTTTKKAKESPSLTATKKAKESPSLTTTKKAKESPSLTATKKAKESPSLKTTKKGLKDSLGKRQASSPMSDYTIPKKTKKEIHLQSS